MRIGIITRPLYANYGGILQNYALQQVLKKMGHTPITLDFMPSLSFGHYLLYLGKNILRHIFHSGAHTIKPYKHYLERPASIDSFVRNYIDKTVTIPKYSKRVLRKYGIDAIIVGSDQVWRYAYNARELDDMFLAFAKGYPCPKIAYAASFGVEKWDYPGAESSVAKELIKQFNAVSVREYTGKVLCKENLGVDSVVVSDPTLLLDAAEYERFCKKPQTIDVPYLAAYVLDANEEKNDFIRIVAESKNLKIREMTVSDNGVAIEEWLSAIRNADFVITDSYHGTLFSIIFKKQFLSFANKERGMDRFLTILNALGLQNRLLLDSKCASIPADSINYDTVSKSLAILRRSSFAFFDALK